MRYPKVVIGFIVALMLITISCDYDKTPNVTILQGIQTIVLLLTAGIVWKYTKETYRLRKVSEKQVEAIFRPTIHLDDPDVERPIIWSCGKGPALDLKIIGFEKGNPQNVKQESSPKKVLPPVSYPKGYNPEIILPSDLGEESYIFLTYKSLSEKYYVTLLKRTLKVNERKLEVIAYSDFETFEKNYHEYEPYTKMVKKLLHLKKNLN